MTSPTSDDYKVYTNSSTSSFVSARVAIATVKYATLTSAYAGSLVVPLGLLILFCPNVLRKTFIFPILVINLILGIILAFLTFIDSINYVSRPFDPKAQTSSLTMAITSLNFLIPILTDTALIFKLLRLFPAFQYNSFQRAGIIALPVLLSFPRLVAMALFSNGHIKLLAKGQSLITMADFLMHSRLPLIECTMQLTSNAYCSTILLIKAYQLLYGNANEEMGTFRSKMMMKRLEMMLKAMASSFFIPVIIQFALIIVYASSQDLIVREPLQWTNVYFSLHCAVLATVWSSIGDASEIKKGQETKTLKKQHSSSYTHPDESKEIPTNTLDNNQYQISTPHTLLRDHSIKRQVTLKRSDSTIGACDRADIMPSSPHLTMQDLTKATRFSEKSSQIPDHYPDIRAGYDALSDLNLSRNPQQWYQSEA